MNIGVLVPNPTLLQRWQMDSLNSLLKIPSVQLRLLVVDTRPPSERAPSLGRTGGVLWRTYFNRRVIRCSVAYQPVRADHLWRNVPVLIPSVRRIGKWAECFSANDIAKIEALDLNFLVRFGFGILRGDILNVAQEGIWSYHLGNPYGYRGGPPGFWEVVDGVPESTFILQRLTEKLDSGVILQQGVVPTVQTSYLKQLDKIAFSAVPLLAHTARERLDPSSTDAPMPDECDSKTIIRHAPNNFEFASFVTKLFVRRRFT